jgi:hypothetical protein
MLNDKGVKTRSIVVSVCSYLYHIVDIRITDKKIATYYWMYEMMTDWVEQDDETDETKKRYKNELRQIDKLATKWNRNYSTVSI